MHAPLSPTSTYLYHVSIPTPSISRLGPCFVWTKFSESNHTIVLLCNHQLHELWISSRISFLRILFYFFLLFHIHDIFFTIPPQICEPELGCCVLYTSFLLCGYFFLSLHFPFDASISVVLDLYSVNFDECNVRKH